MTFEEFKKNFNINLTDQQLEAVQSVENPTLLLAVPGSGKTTVLVIRLGYMIYCCGIKPENILTVTYTVAATRDMQARFAEIFGQELSERLEFRTINGICAKIIAFFSRQIGKKPFELVTDESYKIKLLSAIYMQTLDEYPTESDLKNLSTQITYIKNMMLGKAEIEKLGKETDFPLYEVYKAYCSKLRDNQLMDYDDQMSYALTMLKNSPDLLEYFQNQYQYICVDEAQDTSKIQHTILSLLAKKNDHLFMVGDEDQSIYGFRAAFPEALLNFEKQHENARVLPMTVNFRSNANIVAAADAFIQKNQQRHPKTMTAFRDPSTEIHEIKVKSRRAQYTYLLKVAQDLDRETAVLYRDNESILPVIDLLDRNGIDYRIKNADLTFFTHRIVMDIRNIILFASDQTNAELFMSIYYKIDSYINKAAALEACQMAARYDMTIFDAALTHCSLPVSTIKNIKSLQTNMAELVQEKADKAIYRIVSCMGYGNYLERSQLKDLKVEILRAIAANEDTAIGFLNRLDELSYIIKNKNNNPNCQLILSTIHSSKGLEYDTVYLMDAIDGIFPEKVIINRKRADREEIKIYEEERRLFYVGVTRAKNNLFVFSLRPGSHFVSQLLPSAEEPAEKIVGTPIRESFTPMPKQKKTIKKVSEREYMDKIEEIITTGYIKHKTYGKGRLVSINGDTIVIEFDVKTTTCKLKFLMEHELIE